MRFIGRVADRGFWKKERQFSETPRAVNQPMQGIFNVEKLALGQPPFESVRRWPTGSRPCQNRPDPIKTRWRLNPLRRADIFYGISDQELLSRIHTGRPAPGSRDDVFHGKRIGREPPLAQAILATAACPLDGLAPHRPG